MRETTETVTIPKDGRITISKEARQRLGIHGKKAHAQLTVEVEEDDIID